MSSCAGLTRASIALVKKLFWLMDGRLPDDALRRRENHEADIVIIHPSRRGRWPLLRMTTRCEGRPMAVIRIEPKLDASSGLYYVEIFHPAEAEQPFVTTEPRYKTAAAAENDVIAIIASRANNPRG
jgi:hypothetical protein